MNTLDDIHNDCTRCGLCEQQQAAEGMPVIMCGDLAEEIAAAQNMTDVSPEAYEFLVGCSLCDACTSACPVNISCAQTVRLGRQRLVGFSPELLQDYRAYRVDYVENVFAALRASGNTSYEEYLDKPIVDAQSKGLFFPGCSLTCYSEELTKTVFELLRERDLVQGMTVYCCGKLLGEMGAEEAWSSYGDHVLALLKKQNITRIVVACPNCYYELESLLKSRGITGIMLEALPEVLVEQGFICAKGDYKSLSLHTSCPDRFNQRFAKATQTLLGGTGADLIPMKNDGIDTLCCGAGGMARMNAPTHAAERRIRRLRQFADTSAECLVCSCMSCVNTFLSDVEAPRTKHYLELLFERDIDWQQAHVVYDKMILEHEDMFTLPLEQSTSISAAQSPDASLQDKYR